MNATATRPPGLTNFWTTERDLQVLQAYNRRAMNSHDIADFTALCERADVWLSRLHAPVSANEQPKQPA